MKVLPLYIAVFLSALTLAAPALAKDKFLKSKGQELRYREASAYANSAEKRDIMVGAEYLGKREQKRLLGGQSGKFRALEVAITNNSRFRLYVNEIDLRGSAQSASKPVATLDAIARATGPSGSGNKKGMRLSILRNNLIDKSLQANVILPGETIQGLVFINNKDRGNGQGLRIDLQNLKRLIYLDIIVPLDQ